MPRITQLENILRTDKEGKSRDEMVNRLLQAEDHLRLRLRAPQSQEEYGALQRQVDACASATQAVRTLWGRYHGAVEIGHY